MTAVMSTVLVLLGGTIKNNEKYHCHCIPRMPIFDKKEKSK
jgi:hypothetical protein